MNLKYLKKCIFLLFTIMLILMTLSSCSLLQDAFSDPLENVFESHVQRIKYWQIQHNSGTNDYSVFFAFEDENGKEIAASGTAQLRIEDEESNILYEGTKMFSKSDFDYYSNEKLGSHYYVCIRINDSEVVKGVSESGKLFLTISGDQYRFDEVNCTALYCLPVKDVTLNAEKLPKEIVNKNYSGAVTSKITITDIQYVFGKDSLMSLKITIIGEKNYGENGSLYDDFMYKIYDHEGFMVDNGTVFLSSLAKGDKFKKEITCYDAKPGETYTIKFENG